MSYITCEDLALGYEGRIISDNINFTVNKGDYLCIVGENGAGKTTLLKALLHLIRPLKGNITMGDGLKAYEIGYLPQQTTAQKDFPASVKEIVLTGTLNSCKMRPFYGKRQQNTAEENMKKLSVWELRNRSFMELSGGQKQRVLLARALCATSKVILLDEPVAGLDPMATQDMYKVIEDLNKEGVTIIMISHDIESAVQYASHILHLGSIHQFYGSKDDYLQSDAWKMFRPLGVINNE